MKKKLLKILTIFFLLFLPLFTFAALDLEYYYPPLPSGETISIATSLGDVVKYFLAWAIIIGAIIAFISLIIAGFKYLTSTGRPEIMREAKDRILNSFLGLTILLGSYLILVAVNPELIVMEVERVPIEYGIVLLANDGVTSLNNGDSIEEIVKREEAVYLPNKVSDYKEKFGELVVTNRDGNENPIKLNFENLQVKSIGFLKKSWGEVKVVVFADKNLKTLGGVAEYTSDGKLDENGVVISGTVGEIGGVKVINLDFFETEVDFINIDVGHEDLGDEEKREKDEDSGEISHPPLSFERMSLRSGVYLYSDKPGEEPEGQPLISNRKYLDDIDFNNKTRKIEIKNDEATDFIAVLHEDPDWAGQLRIFFEQRDILGQTVGNTTPGTRVEIRDSDGDAVVDQYGKVKKPSSIHVFKELSDDPSACKQVRLCTGTEGDGDCIVYLSPGETIDFDLEKEGAWIATTTLPIYIPQDIPVTMEVKNKAGDTKPTLAEFADNIKSIYIEEEEGGCLVALFENPTDINNIWEKGTPGKHSQVFTKSDTDLSGDEIGRCGGVIGLMFKRPKPCASAIAIYPTKPEKE